MSKIEASVSGVQGITAKVVGDGIVATVSGVGPQGPGGTGTWEQIAGKPSTFPPAPHQHIIGDTVGLQAALDGKQPVGSYVVTTDARLSDAREWSAATATQAEAEAGTGTDRRAFTPLRVFQAIAAWWAASPAKTKLDGIAAGATANATDAQLRDRSTHTGTQLANTISDFTTAVIAAAPPTTNASLLVDGTLPDARLSSNIARTSDVSSAVAALVNSSPAALDTLSELAAALGNDASFSVTVTNALAAKAPLNNPTFTGTVSGVTKGMIGLGNVDNTSDANKPISTATQTALSGKAASSHSHGSLTADGRIGTEPDQLVVTGAGGALTTSSSLSGYATIHDVNIPDLGTVTFGTDQSLGEVLIAIDGLLDNKADSAHNHGSLTSQGCIGTTSGQIVVTGTGGALTTAATISASSVSGLSKSSVGLGNVPNVDATNANNISSGVIAASRLPEFTSGKVAYVSQRAGSTDVRTGISPYDALRPFATIMAAASATSDGDVIVIEAGAYDSHSATSSGAFTGGRHFVCRPGVSLSFLPGTISGGYKDWSLLGFPAIKSSLDSGADYGDAITVLTNFGTARVELGDCQGGWEGAHFASLSASRVFLNWSGTVAVDGDSSLINITAGEGAVEYNGWFNCHSIGTITKLTGGGGFGTLPVVMRGFFGAHSAQGYVKSGNEVGFGLVETGGGDGRIALSVHGRMWSPLFCAGNVHVSADGGYVQEIIHNGGGLLLDGVATVSVATDGTGLTLQRSSVGDLGLKYGATTASVVAGPDVSIGSVASGITVTQQKSTADIAVQSYSTARANHTGTQDASTIGSGTLNAARLPATAVSAGSYGSASSVATFSVDATGRLTAAGSTPIGISAGAVSGLASVATSGSYNDLSNKPTIPAAYTLPAATGSTLGGVRIGAGVNVDGSGVISVSTAYAAASHTHTASSITDFASAVAAASPEEVVEYQTAASFPATGNSSLLYIATDPSRAYRWTGSQYVEVGSSSAFVQTHTHAASDVTSGVFAAARLPITTQAQAINGTDSVLSTPYYTLRQLKNWKLVNLSDNQRDITVSNSTGSVSVDSLLLRANNGLTTANATAVYRGWAFEMAQYYNAASGQNTVSGLTNWSWSKPLAFAFRMAIGANFASTSTARVQFGKKLVTTTGTIDQQGVGIEVRGGTLNTNGRLWILAHNGTTLTSYDTGLNLNCAPIYDIFLTSDAAGNVICLVNDTAYTTTGGPTTDLLNASSGSGIGIEVTNGNTANAESRLTVSRHIWIAAQ